MIITYHQARTARSLLEIEQRQISEEMGVSRQSISNFEKTGRGLKKENIEKLRAIYETRGVEFTANDGVQRKTKGVIAYEGRDGFAEFRQDVLEQAKTGKADICVINVDEHLFDKWGAGEVNNNYRKAMAALPYAKSRFLSKQNDKHFPASGHAEYRWIPESDFGDFPLYIYGNKTAMIMFEEDEISIFVIEHAKITAFYRKQFNENWNKATIPN